MLAPAVVGVAWIRRWGLCDQHRRPRGVDQDGEPHPLRAPRGDLLLQKKWRRLSPVHLIHTPRPVAPGGRLCGARLQSVGRLGGRARRIVRSNIEVTRGTSCMLADHCGCPTL